ncbi:hypothetical protein DENSPDRAFT_790714 [Dentipellis sp. KUC8613]|nr:hypothetical protein DENSPDRAFT_790714 [Dentipellis sp. KUC8613]
MPPGVSMLNGNLNIRPTDCQVPDTKFSLPAGWDLQIHPQGWVYFYNASKRIVADDNIRDPNVLDALEAYIVTYPLSEIGHDMEICIPGSPSPGDHFRTLVVNHTHCVASYLIEEGRSETIRTVEPYLLNRRRRLYWNYIQWHPCHVPPLPTAELEVREALTWYHVDNVVSGHKSVVPFSKAECEDLSRALKQLKGDKNERSIARTVFLSWVLREIWSFRDAEDYGRRTLRDSLHHRAGRSVQRPVRDETTPLYISVPLEYMVDIIFFAIPRTYVAHVKAATEYQGRLSNMQERWETYIRRLVQQYQDFLLIATVLLSATIGFLDIDGIGIVAKAGGIVSTFASLGSITVGVFFVWIHQSNSHRSTFAYVHNAHHGAFGLLGHAMFLSLPAVFLVWGVIAFTVGFIAYTVQDTHDSDKNEAKAAWASLGVSILVLVLVSAGLYTFSLIWQLQSRSSFFDSLSRRRGRLSWAFWKRSLK